MHCKEIRVSPKIRVLNAGTLSQTLDLENFATASQQNSLTVELVDHSRDDRHVVAGRTLFTTRPSTVMLQLHGFIVQHVHTVMGA